jgi:hypothetical protein
VRANRAFLARVVRYLAGECGVRQFLDIGTGLPVAGNTHQVAQEVAPDARIVYADNDPIVLLHARALLSSTPQGTCDYVQADLRDTATIERAAARTLDFGAPVALMLLIILHLIPDDDDGPVATMRDRFAITRFFDGLDLAAPGVVQPQQWRPEPGLLSPPQVTAWSGVARKR